MRTLILLYILLIMFVVGCTSDTRVYVRPGVASDSLGNNIVIRPVKNAFSALIGQGIVIDNATTRRNPNSGFLELYVSGHNQSPKTKRFRYRVEWIDKDGLVIETKTSVWLPMSAMGNSPFQIKAVAPRAESVNFRMDTRKWE